jgi:hypothetical protein
MKETRMIFEWGVTAAPVYPEHAGQQNVVYAVFWTVKAGDGENEASDSGCIGLDLTGENFTPYSELTRDQVAGWAKAALGSEAVARIEAHLVASIEASALPPVPLPWATEPLTG